MFIAFTNLMFKQKIKIIQTFLLIFPFIYINILSTRVRLQNMSKTLIVHSTPLWPLQDFFFTSGACSYTGLPTKSANITSNIFLYSVFYL